MLLFFVGLISHRTLLECFANFRNFQTILDFSESYRVEDIEPEMDD
jgi:hypothetical protein